jgi:serine/threonine protein kinase
MWSFGCILFEFITGQPPFYNSSLNKLMKMIQDDPVPIQKLRSVSTNLKNLLS